MTVSEAVESIRRDVTSGASAIVRQGVEAFEALLDERPDEASLPVALRDLGCALISAQPAMASMHALVRAVLEAADAAESPSRQVRATLGSFQTTLVRALRQVSERAEGLVPDGGRVMSHSASGTVQQALLHAAARRTFDVVCLEGRPNVEGRRLATALADAGVAVTFAVDAAAASLIRSCDVVLVGADAIADVGAVNKIGTRSLAVGARRTGVPIYILADTTKLLPPGVMLDLEDARGSAEVWPDAPAGVHVWNRYFEATPPDFFDGILTENRLESPADVESVRATLRVPAALRGHAA